jgi:carbonic anhydrase
MKLFESILDANHRAVAGDSTAGLRPDDFAEELPVIALTCIDPRLNAFFPNILGIPAEQFIWLRNAGNIITGPLSSTMRSLALACAVKGGKEIAIIGHTDCQVAKMTVLQLLEKLKALGVDRNQLPENLNEFFGMFATERQNVIKACDFVRNSPLIGPKIPVHGLLADIETGKLEWIVNGYNTLLSETPTATAYMPQLSGPGAIGKFDIGEMKFPETKIGDWASAKVEEIKMAAQEEIQSVQPAIEQVKTTAQKIVAKYGPKGASPQPPKIIAPVIRPPKGWGR